MDLRPIADIQLDIDAGTVDPRAILFRGEPQLLYEYAVKAERTIVELGSYWGGGSVILAKAARDGGHGALVYVIDRHEAEGSVPDCECEPGRDWKKWYLSILGAGVADIVRPIGLWSHECDQLFDADEGGTLGPIDFLFIDGAHDARSVKRDADDWLPLVYQHGAVAFHDTHLFGPRGMITEILEYGHGGIGWRIAAVAGSIAVLEREE